MPSSLRKATLLGFVALVAGADQVYVAGSAVKKLYIVGGDGWVKQLALPGNPLDLALPGAGEFLYISLPTQESVSVLRTSDNTLVAPIQLSEPPAKMAAGNRDTRLYVAHDTNAPPHVSIIDISKSAAGRQNTVCGSIDLTAHGAASAFAVGTFGDLLAVGTRSGHVLLYDTSVLPPAFIASQQLGARVRHVVFSPLGEKLYVLLGTAVGANDETGRPTIAGNLHVLRVPKLALKTVLAAGSGGLRSAVIAGTSSLYATDVRGAVHQVDIGTDTVLRSASIGGNLSGIVPAGARLLVADSARDVVSSILPADLKGEPGFKPVLLEPHATPTSVVVLRQK